MKKFNKTFYEDEASKIASEGSEKIYGLARRRMQCHTRESKKKRQEK